MLDDQQLADLLAKMSGYFYRQEFLQLDKSLQNEAIRDLNSYGILSLNVLASVVGTSVYRVRQALSGHELPTTRGKLNPHHIAWLGYMLSTGDANKLWLQKMIGDGTTVGVIADLTGISRATIYRRLEDE